jgi:beta-N-acetylhexosaminidase
MKNRLKDKGMAKLVGSTLMLGFRGGSLSDPETREDIAELKAACVRGVILFDHDIAANHQRNIHSPKQLAKLIEDLRNELGSDLIIALDQEGGEVARLDARNGFLPTFSAAEFADFVEIDQVQYADRQAKQLSTLGIDLNFAPCVDLAVEPNSPIIAGNGRSFGASIEDVARCAQIAVDAHHRFGVRCCIKHFPGHGSALMDSHLGVCEITKTHTQDEIDIFTRLIETYRDSIAVMSGHLMHQGIDESFPASLSEQHTQVGLRDGLGFDGVVITDSLDMRAIRDQFGEEESASLALNAGADLILDGLNAPGYREPGAPGRLALAIAQGVDRQRLEQSRDRLDRFFGK